MDTYLVGICKLNELARTDATAPQGMKAEDAYYARLDAGVVRVPSWLKAPFHIAGALLGGARPMRRPTATPRYHIA